MRLQPLLALDLGSSKVACVVGRPQTNGLKFEVLGAGLAHHPTVMATWPCDPALLAGTIEQALQTAHVTQPIQQAAVVLSHPQLAHSQVMAEIDLADEPVTIRNRALLRLKTQALAQGLGFDREALYLGAVGYTASGFERVRNPRGLVATRLRGLFQLVSIPLAVRRAVVEAVEAVGLEVERIHYSLEAIAAACLNESLSPKRCLVIDIGGCSTQVGIVAERCLEKSLSIPWGGMTLACALAPVCRLTMEQALAASLKGLSSSNTQVRSLTEQQLRVVQQGLQQLLKREPLPDVAIVTGRGALIDGLVEWIEETTEIKAVLGRSPRAKALGDLSSQVAFSPALGLLELAFQPSEGVQTATGSLRLVDRLIDRTKRILVEYF